MTFYNPLTLLTRFATTTHILFRRLRWAAALVSGRYKQGQNVLHHVTTDAYCCLGVACEVYGKCSKRKTETHLVVLGSVMLYDAEGETPPCDVRQYFGLDFLDVQNLAEANDAGVPFRTLAWRILRLPIVT